MILKVESSKEKKAGDTEKEDQLVDPFTLHAIYPKSWLYSSSDQHRKMNFMKDETECSTRFLREREHSLSIGAEQANFCSVPCPYVCKNPHVGVGRGGGLEDAGHTGPHRSQTRKQLCFKYLPLLQEF